MGNAIRSKQWVWYGSPAPEEGEAHAQKEEEDHHIVVSPFTTAAIRLLLFTSAIYGKSCTFTGSTSI